MRLTKRYVVVAALVGAIAAISAVAFAQNPHFIGTPTCTKSVTSGLTCSGSAAGLGNGPTAAFLTADSITATYVCKNHGGNIAPGQPVVTQSVTGPTQTITPHNGRINFSPNIPPPTPPSPATECPNGNWKVVLTSLSYTNVVLHIEQPAGTPVLTFNFGDIDP
ncbi:MAG TPA: hypothetical protein VKB73_05760 [Gaiellaceae bacterium]|nr:hypothetical protein [Gaiellaceae bacterium]